MSASVLILLSYGLMAIFAVAFVARSAKLARMPAHLRWELAPVPHEKGRASYGGSYLEEVDWWTKPREKDHLNEILYMGKEILFLKALWEHKRSLWWFSFPFHVGLYLLTAALGVLVVGGAAWALGISGPGWGILRLGIPLLTGVGYGLGVVGAIGLFVVRMTDPGMRNSTNPMTYFNLVLLLGLFGSGLWAIFTPGSFHMEVLGFVGALFSGSLGGEVPQPLSVHILFAGVFLAYLPFTPMMHFVAKYFTYHKVRWDDEPVKSGSRLDRELKMLLNQSVTWAAPHVRADGKKTWVDIAMDSGKSKEVGK